MGSQAELALRKKIVEIHRRIYELGYSVDNDGNTSVRLASGRILITPKGHNKAALSPKDIVAIDGSGKPVAKNQFPSSETATHLAIYRARPDVAAIVHAHPPYAVACTLAGVSLEEPLLPELILSIGKIPTTPYVTPGTDEAAEVVAERIRNHDGLIMERHGSVTVGTSLDEALLKLERLEHAAKIVAIARSMGPITPLATEEIKRLMTAVCKAGTKK